MDETTKQNCQLLTAKALAKILSISVRTIWRLRSTGKLPKPIAVGHSVRWRHSDIELWEALGCPDQKKFEEHKKAGQQK